MKTKTKNQKGRITRKTRRSYKRTTLTPTVPKKQVAMLAEVSFALTFKRRFFAKLTNKELEALSKLGAALYTLGFEAAGGTVK